MRNLSLTELQLSPSSVLWLKFEDESLNGRDIPAPLAPEIGAQAVDVPVPPDFDTKAPDASAESSKRPAVASASGEKKVPKWFKGLASEFPLP